MPSTVYKGDIAEVAFGTEAGMRIEQGIASATIKLLADSNDGNDTSKLEITGGVANSPVVGGILEYPKGLLVGSRLVLVRGNNAASTIDVKDDYDSSGRIFTIVEFVPNSASTKTEITITPKLLTARTLDITLDATGSIGDRFEILPYKTPSIDVANTFDDAATTSSESVLTDQFLGLTSALTLPETKVDLKRFHVVGLGRDVSVQVPGKFITEGGSFEVAMHSARWLKYCLGQELVYGLTNPTDQTANTLSAASNTGDSHLELTTAPSLTNFDVTGAPSAVTIGDYIHIVDTTTADIVSDHEPDAGDWDGAFTGLFDTAETQEVRRIVAIAGSRIFLNQPLDHPHVNGTTVQFYRYQSTNLADYGNPLLDATTKNITRPVTHLLYSKTTLPSFSLEVSHRRRDINSDQGTADGGSGDSKELNRVYRGCKVTDFTLTTDNDAALRLSVNFNSALCYTDTGRLEATTPGSRYAAHRMFDDTAATEVGRYVAGIGKGTQKPFMFYNGSVDVAGQKVAQVLNFTLTGQTGVQSYYAINGNSVVESDTAQVPFGGSRNPSTMIEGQTTYDLTMEIIVDDPIFFHKMRTSTEFFQDANKQILLAFEKNGSGATRSRMNILIDDYYIVEAPLQIPEDKGPVKSTIKIMPKSIKVVSRDTILQY